VLFSRISNTDLPTCFKEAEWTATARLTSKGHCQHNQVLLEHSRGTLLKESIEKSLVPTQVMNHLKKLSRYN